ncbi:MAG: LuxR C-terminal-related transcriptional regulator [Cyanobacteria bacterium J06634_6]
MHVIKETEVSLQALFAAIAQAPNEAILRKTLVPLLSKYFSANRCRFFYAADFLAVEETMPKMMRQALSLDYNPVLRYLVHRHTAVHDEVVLPPGVWKTICPRADHGHVMTGPIIQNGQLFGGIAFTRHRDKPAFDANDLADVSALCLHLSSQLTVLSTQPKAATAVENHLTPREYEIAALVAQGLTNKKIGEALWITENSVKQALKRMYRKLEVSSRAEMVAKLAISSTY